MGGHGLLSIFVAEDTMKPSTTLRKTLYAYKSAYILQPVLWKTKNRRISIYGRETKIGRCRKYKEEKNRGGEK